MYIYCKNDTWTFQCQESVFFSSGEKLATHLHIVSRLRLSGVVAVRPPTCLHGVERDNFTSFKQNNWYIKQLYSARYSSSCCIFPVHHKSHCYCEIASAQSSSQNLIMHQAWVHILTGHFAKIFHSYASVSLAVSSHDLLQQKFILHVLFPHAASEVGSYIYHGGRFYEASF